jgi:hypothetical protein
MDVNDLNKLVDGDYPEACAAQLELANEVADQAAETNKGVLDLERLRCDANDAVKSTAAAVRLADRTVKSLEYRHGTHKYSNAVHNHEEARMCWESATAHADSLMGEQTEAWNLAHDDAVAAEMGLWGDKISAAEDALMTAWIEWDEVGSESARKACNSARKVFVDLVTVI